MLFLFKEINLITVFCVFTKNRFFLLLPLLKKYLLMIIIIAHLARHKLCFHLRFWWRINSNGSNAKMSWFDWLIWYLYKTVRPFYVRFADGFYCLVLPSVALSSCLWIRLSFNSSKNLYFCLRPQLWRQFRVSRGHECTARDKST